MLKKVLSGSTLAALALAAMMGMHEPAAAADPPKPAAAPAGAKVDYTKITPVELEKQTPKGQLKNPYNDKQADIVADGEKIFLGYSCNGCHGGGGGGGMCPPLTNDVWVYDGDDDTLFRLVTLGTVDLQKEGYTRKGSENVVGPMPAMGPLIKSADELWRILTFVRSKYSASADQAYKYGTPADQK